MSSLCLCCQGRFDKNRPWQKYCTRQCAAAERRRKRAAGSWRPSTSLLCGACGAAFEPKRYNQRFCGPACQRAHNRGLYEKGKRFHAFMAGLLSEGVGSASPNEGRFR
jgi:hypothetical protein